MTYVTAERNGEIQDATPADKIANLNQTITDLKRQINLLQLQTNENHGLILRLTNEIDAYRKSKSWRITQPMRELKSWRITQPMRELLLLNQKRVRLLSFYQNYRHLYPGTDGYMRLLYKSIHTVLKGGVKELRKTIITSEMVMLAKSLFDSSLSSENRDVHELDLLKKFYAIALVVDPTILFDHNGGGGTNIYTKALVNKIITEGGSVLRVYPFNNVWFIQWIGKYRSILFNCLLIDELFKALSQSHSASIIINSLYGHPNINISATHIINLTRNLSATLDFKLHDFNALCPSPHLLNFEGDYCGVPKNAETCINCLKYNQSWYHSWYPEQNKPTDIDEWRKPFEMLLNAADTLTVFDSSAIEILSKAFSIDNSKINIAPHTNNYFTCDKTIDLNGPLHIGLLGSLSKMKGGEVIKELHTYIKNQGMQIPITIVGPSFIELPPDLEIYGNYEPNDLPNIISKRGINVILMASITPETFSYTISEAMKMRLPVVAFDIGAQGNRVKEYELGKVIPLESSPAEILVAIQFILKVAQEQIK